MVLAAIAWHQPITRAGLKEIFGREIGRNLIATGPRAPHRGALSAAVAAARVADPSKAWACVQ